MKKTDTKTILQNAKGQMTVFFATTVLVLITFIAFIVNIGIFVKAKINLQNAVDAAAYAGASVQARQLSNIAYLNWEMRNVYKEWMFKTYVLGNMSLAEVSGASSNPVKFLMEPYNSTSTGSKEVQDGYNVPSVCLDYSSSGNVALCKKALVLGLPRFDSTDVLGMEETMDAFVDALGSQKAQQCAARTNVNFLTNFIWAYNVPDVPELDVSDMAANAPAVASERPGAFPAAFNLALRIRSLEAQVNRAPYSGVCIAGSCENPIGNLVNAGGRSPADERVYKAFLSGFKNIGGTDCDDPGADEMKCSFTLTELAPNTPDVGNSFSLSNLLIPSSKPQALEKNYLDLKLMPVNYATFFTMLAPVSTEDGVQTGGLSATSTSECVATKVGMPVPGYPLGFAKNPDVVTYYAVKGEADFVGLFNPFASKSIKLTAFAAAKPFGGRIGPMLFKMNHGTGGNPSYLLPRFPHYKSSPYVSALDASNPVDRYGNIYTGSDYQEGMPIPGNYGGMPGGFWLKDETSAIGGWIDESNIFFAVPNLPYDYPSSDPNAFSSYFANSSVQKITPLPKGVAPTSKAGLYNKEIFDKFKGNLVGLAPGTTVSTENINEGILLARAPTLYDAYNYMIPTPEQLNQTEGVDSYGIILSDVPPKTIGGGTNQVFNMQIYGPLMDSSDPNALYGGPSDLETVLNDYMSRQEPAIAKYRGAMNVAGKAVYEKGFSERTGANFGIRAANMLSGIGQGDDDSLYGQSATDLYNNVKPNCQSVNGKFVWFFTGKTDQVNHAAGGCETKNTLRALMRAHWNNIQSDAKARFHVGDFILPESGPRSELFSAYRPGPMNDADANGQHTNFLQGAKTNMSRNFYSAKFTTLNSLTNGGDETLNGNFAIFSEGNRAKGAMNDTKGTFKNYLKPDVGIDISKIRH